MNKNQSPNYYAIIPASVRYDNLLSANAKLLYGEITSLCNKEGYCWATNGYFAELYNVSNKSISLWIKQLIDNKYLKSTIIYKEGTNEILHRYLHLCNEGIEKNFHTPMEEKVKDNSTSINTKFNTKTNKEKYKKENLATENLAKRTIDFLNQSVNKSFGYTDGNLKEIKSQINKLTKNGDDLKTIEDKFAYVIKVKSKEWLNNQEMKKHLNPVTLFRESNFDKYLNQDMGFSTSDLVDKIYEARGL